MSSALIGYTGFVGSNIHRQADFVALYNSKNINEIIGKSFDLVVCAGVPAIKWWANQNPDEDFAIVQSLAAKYKKIKAKRFVLISTVDVYPKPLSVNEDSLIDPDCVCPYGKHRLWLEKELDGVFEHFHVIRLPGLFGKGLKKNILFDMLCGNILEKINLDSSFQWYPLSRIWQDIQTTIHAGLPLVNLAVEPVSSQVIQQMFFSELEVGSDPFPVAKYDMHTKYANVFSLKHQSYMLTAQQVLKEMALWLEDPEVNCG